MNIVYLSYTLLREDEDDMFFSFLMRIVDLELLTDFLRRSSPLDVLCWLLVREPDGFSDFPKDDGTPLFDRARDYFSPPEMGIFVDTALGLYTRGVRMGVFTDMDMEEWPDTITM
jgi:hypothetical protein